MACPGEKRSGTVCAVDNTPNKAGLGAGAAPGPDGRPERAPLRPGAVPGGRRGGGSVEGLLSRQPPPGVSTNIYSTRKQQLLPFQ